MAKEKYASLSKFISLVLRHHPEIAGITLDSHGWANVNELIDGVNRARMLDIDILREIVATDEKGRYSFNEDGTKIRTNQGHSVDVDVELQELEPPEILYHGTCIEATASINAEGLKPMTRLYVHLWEDYGPAMKNGRRKGDHKHPIVYRVKAGEMFRDGHKFYRSVNGVWQSKFIPPQYLEQQSQ